MDTLWIILVLAVYLGAISFLGYMGYRKTVRRSDYLVAGRSTHPFVMALSYGAAFISTSAIVGFGGIAGLFGLGLLWLPFMNIAIGIFIAFLVFGKRTRSIGSQLNAHTFPEFIGLRFHSRYLKVATATIIILFMPIYTSVVLIGGARFLQEAFKMNYHLALFIFAFVVAVYVIMGGLKGVMYVDALMGCVMIGGMLALLSMCYYRLDGVINAHQALTNMADLVPENLKAVGHQGWTTMPKFNSEWWWTLCSSLMFGVGIGALAQPQLAVRFMTVKSTRELNRAMVVGAIFILLTATIVYLVGAMSNVWFYEEHGMLAIEFAKGNSDLIMPLFISEAMPPFFVCIFAVTLLSAAMSTLSSLFHVTGSALGYDFYCNLANTRKASTFMTKVGIIFGIAVSIILGYILPAGIVARGTAIFFGICAAAFLPTYVAALYWRRASLAGVWASIITGAALSIFGLLFLHRKESAALGICNWITGKSELISGFPWPFVDTIVYSLPISAVVLVVVSLATKPVADKVLDRIN